MEKVYINTSNAAPKEKEKKGKTVHSMVFMTLKNRFLVKYRRTSSVPSRVEYSNTLQGTRHQIDELTRQRLSRN